MWKRNSYLFTGKMIHALIMKKQQYECVCGSLLTQIRVTWTQILQYHNSQSDNKMATKWPMAGHTQQRDDSSPGWDEREGRRFHHPTQNSSQFKTYELFIFLIFHLIFSDGSWPQVTEMAESETTDYCVIFSLPYVHPDFAISHTCSTGTPQWHWAHPSATARVMPFFVLVPFFIPLYFSWCIQKWNSQAKL